MLFTQHRLPRPECLPVHPTRFPRLQHHQNVALLDVVFCLFIDFLFGKSERQVPLSIGDDTEVVSGHV